MNGRKKVDILQTRISPDARKEFVSITQKYLKNEHDLELGDFEAEELLEFLCRAVAPVFYNQGVQDAKDFFMGRLVEITEDIVQIEIGD